MRIALFLALFMFIVAHAPVFAQAPSATDDRGPGIGDENTLFLKIGVIVTAADGPCRGIVATSPVPLDWPEQEVRIVDEDISPAVRGVAYRDLGHGVKQMLVSIPFITAGEEVHALVTYEIKRRDLSPPAATDVYTTPKKLDRDLRRLLAPSPYIESRHAKIRTLAKEIGADSETDWEKVEAFYDWVRDNVKYENGPLKGALRALQDGAGDCEELTSLFIAICRAADIPARTVWVPGHCYPEFYLQDDDGLGHWFPCQAAGTRSFGGMPESRPILQKGDNFRDPDRPGAPLRYVSEFLTGRGGRPKVKFVREEVPGVADVEVERKPGE